MSWGRPYGWGCRWEPKPSYCARFAEIGTKACRGCSHILEEDKEKWMNFFDEFDINQSVLEGNVEERQK
jgi:hypothetical protein